MTTTTSDTRQRVLTLVQENPKISAAEIARQVGVSRQRVHELLEVLGYTLKQEWKKGRRKRNE